MAIRLKIKKEHEGLIRQMMPSNAEVNAELKHQLSEALEGNPVFESWNITGYLYDKES